MEGIAFSSGVENTTHFTCLPLWQLRTVLLAARNWAGKMKESHVEKGLEWQSEEFVPDFEGNGEPQKDDE